VAVPQRAHPVSTRLRVFCWVIVGFWIATIVLALVTA
jgi:hypothetical protein